MFLEHVNLTVSDLDRSVAFYCGLLGLRVRWQREAAELPAAAHVGDDRHYIAMFQAPPGSTRPSTDYDAVGLNHFGFHVEDLKKTLAVLERQGVEIAEQGSRGKYSFVFVRGPDNELIGFAEI